MTARLGDPLTRVVGDRTGKALATIGLRTVGDLLHHYPRRYEAPGRLTDLAHLATGEHVTVQAQVARTTRRSRRGGSGYVVTVLVTDGRETLTLTFFPARFGAAAGIENRYRVGRTGLFTGTVGEYRGTRQLTHPDAHFLDEEDDALAEASRPIPVYAAGAQVPSWAIAQAARVVLDPLVEEDLPDPLPEDLRRSERLVGLLEALRGMHRPEVDEDWRRGRARMRFEEAFVLQVALARRRAQVAHLRATPRPPRLGGLLEAFDAQLPFRLTAGQREVGAQVGAELARGAPMQRLLQGEVGSGKTVVALRAVLQVVDAGGQAAVLAPTEVLAAQHLRSITRLLGPLAEAGMLGGAEAATRVTLLTGSLSAAARRQALLEAASGSAGIVIGTHALLSEGVRFAELGLVVVDEQHRFGVEQRDALRAKADGVPHLLVMTATPIPRTVAMTVFGDLEVSTLREIPAGRAAVSTHVVPAANAAWLARGWARAREEVGAGHRVYVVCPRISADEGGVEDQPGEGLQRVDGAGGGPSGGGPGERDLAAVLSVAEELRSRSELAGVEVGVLHGRLAPEEKDRVMAAFAAGDVGVLVATTVIEVGVDVPEATMMVVLDADRFGISQLHQLRGRVGRGSAPGLCLLVSGAEPDTPAAERLAALAATTDGFALAGLDLRQRREGDVLGAAQSGRGSSLRLLRVIEDADVIARARDVARDLVAQDPDLEEHAVLAEALTRMLDEGREEFLDRA